VISILRHVAPAGAPIGLVDLLRWVGTAASTADVTQALRQHICARSGVREAFLTSTGRAGMTLLLEAMRRLASPGRDEVVIPAYTCYSVAASVVKAKLRPRLVDISPATLDYEPADLESTDFSRVLAIIATNLYGSPSNLPSLAALARDRGVFLIDDAAQAMGATVSGRWCGTFGDAGLFSFDKGKNVSAIDGGVIVTSSDDLAAALRERLANLPAPSRVTSAVHVMKALAYAMMLHPRLYGIPNSIPQLGLGKTAFTTDFQLAAADPLLAALALTMMRRLDEFARVRTRNAAALMEGLRSIRGVQTVASLPAASAAHLRFPILCFDAITRRRTLQQLRRAGIGASESYPSALADVPELRPHLVPGFSVAGGRHVAHRILTLPTHPFVTPRDISQTITALRTIDGAGARFALKARTPV